MTIRAGCLRAVDKARGICDSLGLRQTSVTVRTRTWSGGRVQNGIATNSDLPIVPRPHVVGESGDPVIELHLTPAHAKGGYTPAQLNPVDQAGVEFFYAVTFPDGAERAFMLTRIDTSRPLRYTLHLQSTDRKVPW